MSTVVLIQAEKTSPSTYLSLEFLLLTLVNLRMKTIASIIQLKLS